jgi:hypothetical protein
MSQTYSSQQQLLVQSVVSVMELSIFSTSLGMMITAAGMRPKPGTQITDAGVRMLSQVYGSDLVVQALDIVPSRDMVTLAKTLDQLVYNGMVKKYGEWAAKKAVISAVPGDIKGAEEIARSLTQGKVTEGSPTATQEQAVKRGRMRGRSKAKKVKDTKTGKVYDSMYQAGKDLAREYGLSPMNTYAYYSIVQKDPTRLVVLP